MGRKAAPDLVLAQQLLGPLRGPIATQGRSYKGWLEAPGGLEADTGRSQQ